MKDLEILCRASAFVVGSSSGSYQNQLHVVTASHNVAPWKFPKIYPDEWLQFINEKNTHYTIEVRHPDGIFMTQTELLPVSFHHSSGDLAVMHLEKDADGFNVFTRLGLEPHKLSTEQLFPGDNISIDGHSIVAAVGSSKTSNFDSGESDVSGEGGVDVRLPVPTTVPGSFVCQSMFQKNARMQHQVNHGMSGGPVTCKKGKESVRGATRNRTAVQAEAVPTVNGDVCGLLVGMVPEDSADIALRGLACFVGTSTIAE